MNGELGEQGNPAENTSKDSCWPTRLCINFQPYVTARAESKTGSYVEL